MKRLLIIPIALLILNLLRPLNVHCADEPGFAYSLLGQEAVITGFTGAPDSLDIPPVIEGLPVTSVRDNAFYKCESLKRITLPDSVTEMGHHCFYGCSALEEVILPKNLKKLGMGCFYGCSALTSVNLPVTLTNLPDSCFRSCTSLTDILIPQGVTAIEKFCFCGCRSLKYVSLSGRLENIGIGTFYQCDSLDTIYIPPSVISIGTEALGFTDNGRSTGINIIGSSGSATEDYADGNDLPFSASPEAVQVFDPAHSDNAPVKLPPALVAAGGLLFLLTGLLAAKQYIQGRK